jgi:hypothetical protein
MRKAALIICLVGVLGLGPSVVARAGVQAATDESLFREIKLLVFDKDWRPAVDKIEELREKFPFSPWAGQALFYKGECLNGLGGRDREALRAFKDYLQLLGARADLIEEAEGRIIDIAFDLYEGGQASALRDIETRLGAANDVVRYYAAYKLSFASDKKTAAKAVPVLTKIVEAEKDPELLDRARIALLRISPQSLKSAEEGKPRSSSRVRLLRIRIVKPGEREPVFSLNIPFALADLALSAMDEDDKAAMRRKGYDVNRILDELVKSKQSILRIAGNDGAVIEIWID